MAEVDRTLILTPGDAYREMSRLEAGRDYMQMASTDYGSLVTFDPDYAPIAEEEDYHEVVSGGPKGDFNFVVFYNQPVIEVNGLECLVESTSNLMLLGSEEIDGEEIWFPYAEAIEVRGENYHVGDFIASVVKLYTKNNWKFFVYGKNIPKRGVDCQTDRFDRIQVINPEEVLRFAQDTVGFNPNKFPWKE